MNTKNRILELLEKYRGTEISGEFIADMLHVSRNTVWKAVKELRNEGYQIVAVTNKGYCLSNRNDIISAQGIKPFLSQNGQAYAEKIHCYQSLESTNRTAKELAIAGAEHGTVVIADSQTAGRGRQSHDFFSPAGGGLYFSIILRPEALRFQHITAITAFAAVAVCETIEDVCGKKPTVKWVNDILIDGKKVCGILTEAVTDLESGDFQWIVLGIGINVYIHRQTFPGDLYKTATSLYSGKGKMMRGVRNRLAAGLINRIVGFSDSPEEAEILRQYKKRLMMLGKEITVVQGDHVYRAVARDIDDAGNLIVETGDGETTAFSSGEIHIRQ